MINQVPIISHAGTKHLIPEEVANHLNIKAGQKLTQEEVIKVLSLSMDFIAERFNMEDILDDNEFRYSFKHGCYIPKVSKVVH